MEHLHPKKSSITQVEDDSFKEMTKSQLIDYAREYKIDISSVTLKDDIREIIEESVAKGDV